MSDRKTVVFYTKDAGLSVADVKRMESEGLLCVKVKDANAISAPAFSSARWFTAGDKMAMIVWQAMRSSSIARDEFCKLMIKEIDSQISGGMKE